MIAAHTGYARLGVRHERRIDAVPDHGWRVLDTLIGHGEHQLESRLRLHPTLHWRATDGRYQALTATEDVLLEVEPFGHASVSVEQGEYAERFSTLEPTQVLKLTRHTAMPAVFGYWLLLPGADPAVV
jgi:hypothetical protein